MSKTTLDIRITRVYDAPQTKDRYRVLVDRIWPRGIKKTQLHLDEWMKDIAPSNELRKWFHHDPDRWEKFCQRYHAELATKAELVEHLRQIARGQSLLLLFAAHDVEHNNAVALKMFLNKKAC